LSTLDSSDVSSDGRSVVSSVVSSVVRSEGRSDGRSDARSLAKPSLFKISTSEGRSLLRRSSFLFQKRQEIGTRPAFFDASGGSIAPFLLAFSHSHRRTAIPQQPLILKNDRPLRMKTPPIRTHLAESSIQHRLFKFLHPTGNRLWVSPFLLLPSSVSPYSLGASASNRTSNRAHDSLSRILVG